MLMRLQKLCRFTGLLAVAGVVSMSSVMGGCHATNNGGGLASYSGGPQSIASTEKIQKSVRMIDLRSGEVFFAIDIPPGKKLTYDFDSGDGDHAVYTPDIMRYEVKDADDQFGKLGNAMTVPNAASRRVDVFVTQSVQYANQSPASTALRTDTPADRPDWWTPRGGALPDYRENQIYDN